MKHRLIKLAELLIVVCLFLAAVWILARELRHYHYHEIIGYARRISNLRLIWALLTALLGYAVLSIYDYLAFRYIRRELPYRRIALASFISYAFSHNLGAALLSGGSVRYRLYSAWGLSTFQITSVILFGGLTFFLGFLTVSGIVFLMHPLPIPPELHMRFVRLHPLGVAFLATVTVYLVFCGVRKEPLRLRGWEIAVPSFPIGLAQLVVASIDWVLAGSVLMILLPRRTLPLPAFMGVFLLAQMAGLVSHVPGGLGVFETVTVLFLSSHVRSPDHLLAALVLYRIIYYVVPLAVAAALLLMHELYLRRQRAASLPP